MYKLPPNSNLFKHFNFNFPFNENNINLVHKLTLPLPSIEALAGANDNKWRKSKIKWILPSPEFSGLYDVLKEIILTSNSKVWNFDVSSSIDHIQYTEYYGSNEGKYDWHVDSLGDTNRKLSLVIQLSNPNEYEGGELQIKNYFDPLKPPFTIPKKMGQITVFPSFLWHRVTPVTKGIRKSLVWWVGGAPFR